MVAWRRRLVAHDSSPHPQLGWTPNSNYGSAEAAEDDAFNGMRGDEGDIVEDTSSNEEDDEDAPDWEEAAINTIRAMLARIPHGLCRGDQVVVWFARS